MKTEKPPRVALITGASRGIGRSIAIRLATDGFSVVFNYRSNPNNIAELITDIESRGGRAMSARADVSNEAEVGLMVKTIHKLWGSVDILVNNAGIRKDQLLMRMTESNWDDVLDTNLKGAFLCSKAVLPVMMKKRFGRIVNISSIVGLTGNPGQGNYAASKAGIIGLTKTIAREVASRNITSNAIAPGYIDTDMVKELPAELRNRIQSMIPLGRLGTAEDVAGMVAFLCGEEANYITGQIIGIDGGLGA
ncbi:3-oxoacyl-[acyl-carrier-protein] reductase [SAR202 cluster bacterium AC-409-J13_OGT_754m]|nr:3-oxoacyl-[acyl-carrier-protein] reductase [SAR202 cluster bacterium AC-409-J13_OGT_754m]